MTVTFTYEIEINGYDLIACIATREMFAGDVVWIDSRDTVVSPGGSELIPRAKLMPTTRSSVICGMVWKDVKSNQLVPVLTRARVKQVNKRLYN